MSRTAVSEPTIQIQNFSGGNVDDLDDEMEKTFVPIKPPSKTRSDMKPEQKPSSTQLSEMSSLTLSPKPALLPASPTHDNVLKQGDTCPGPELAAEAPHMGIMQPTDDGPVSVSTRAKHASCPPQTIQDEGHPGRSRERTSRPSNVRSKSLRGRTRSRSSEGRTLLSDSESEVKDATMRDQSTFPQFTDQERKHKIRKLLNKAQLITKTASHEPHLKPAQHTGISTHNTHTGYTLLRECS